MNVATQRTSASWVSALLASSQKGSVMYLPIAAKIPKAAAVHILIFPAAIYLHEWIRRTAAIGFA